MIPTGNSNGTTKTRKGNRNWLQVEKLTEQPQEAKIKAVKYENNQYGEQLILKLAFQGETIFWTVRRRNPNYEILTSKFGSNENDYVDQPILLLLQADKFSGDLFPTVTFPKGRK